MTPSSLSVLHGSRLDRRRHAQRPNPRLPRPLFLESLEDRTLLSGSATLDINNTTGVLSYEASLGVNNNLTVTYVSSKYVFTETAESITLGPGARADGWTTSGTDAVAGPGTNVKSIDIDTFDGNDSVAIQGSGAPPTSPSPISRATPTR